MGVRSEGRGRSAGSNSDNIIVVGNQHEASRCMLVYDSVSFDREILARQDHLKNARLKTRTAPPPLQDIRARDAAWIRGLQEAGGEGLG